LASTLDSGLVEFSDLFCQQKRSQQAKNLNWKYPLIHTCTHTDRHRKKKRNKLLAENETNTLIIIIIIIIIIEFLQRNAVLTS